MSTQQLTHKKAIVGLLTSGLLVIFGLYIISKANVLADTINGVDTLLPYSTSQIGTGGATPGVEYVQSNAKFENVPTIIGTVFNLVIGIGGGIFVLLLLVGGIIYLTGAGNDEQTGKAKKVMIDAIIGLFIILASWGIGTWVINAFTIDSRAGTTSGVGSGASGGSTGEVSPVRPIDVIDNTTTTTSDLPSSDYGSPSSLGEYGSGSANELPIDGDMRGSLIPSGIN